jgi:hypothetical protein
MKSVKFLIVMLVLLFSCSTAQAQTTPKPYDLALADVYGSSSAEGLGTTGPVASASLFAPVAE